MSSENLDRCDPNDPILLPEIKHEDEADKYYRTNAPGWERIVRIEANGKRTPLKPLIRCRCGQWSDIGLHHVHADGRVTASYFHATAQQLAAMGAAGKRFSPGCGWHVFIKLVGYDLGEFLPEK